MLRPIAKAFTILSALITILFFLILGIILYYNSPNSYHAEDKRFIVESGLTLRQVVEKLHQEKIVRHPNTFLYLGQIIKGVDPKVRYGEYFFEKNTSYYKILHKMVRGNIFFRKLTIAEGLSNHSAYEIIDNAIGLVGDMPLLSKENEGSILPETYFYSHNDSKKFLVKRMKDQMSKAIDELWPKRDKTIPIRTKREAIILASIVEKETGVFSERGYVASVFVNRLKKGMKLQSDPTIIYSYAFGNKSLERPIRVSDIRNKSPYNTYHIYGLPDQPICNPGIDSIKAVLNPIETEYLYFVASGYGDHIFSTNLRDHNRNVMRYRKLMRERKKEDNL